jgi:acetyl-CoA carboxylase biotin carboxyl carrier protein
VDYKEILNLMKEMNKSALTKLEVEEEGFRICIEKSAAITNTIQAAYPNTAYIPAFNQELIAQPQPSYQIPSERNIAEAMTSEEKKDDEANCKKLVSPMVGTFYSAPAPDKPCFVKVGDKVKKGQTICIIEAMKLMNEIESEHDGEIVKILVNNEDMVEFGQPLYLIK